MGALVGFLREFPEIHTGMEGREAEAEVAEGGFYVKTTSIF